MKNNKTSKVNNRNIFLTKDIEVLTSNGWKHVDQLNADDDIAILKNSILNFNKVISVMSQTYIGNSFLINNEFCEGILFPDNNYFHRQSISGKTSITPFKTPKTLFFKNTFKWSPSVTSTLPQHLLQNDFIRFLTYYIKFGKIELLLNRQSTKSKITRRVRISCKDEKSSQEFATILTQFNKLLSFELDCRKKDLDFIICNNSLGLFLQNFGQQKCNFLTGDIKNLSVELLVVFVETLFSSKESRYFCENKKLAEDILEIILKSGRCGVLQDAENGYIVKYFGKKDSGFKINSSDIEELNFNGLVYNVETINLPIFVRRNGKCYWL